MRGSGIKGSEKLIEQSLKKIIATSITAAFGGNLGRDACLRRLCGAFVLL
jgi:H+/Cl- antiporter ClcA